MGMYKDSAADYAERATVPASEDTAAEALGNGLAAVAYALLELADMMDDIRRELTNLREERR